jgi:hypothetical protein
VQQAVGSNTISETYRYDSFLRRSYRLHTETSPSTTVQELYVYDRTGTSIVGSTDPSGTARYANDPGNIVGIRPVKRTLPRGVGMRQDRAREWYALSPPRQQPA